MVNIYESPKHGWVCELWGASTKHPDSIFYFDDFKKTEYVSEQSQVYQWLLECSSKLTWPFHAHDLATEAEKYYIWDRGYYMVHLFFETGDAESGPSVHEEVELILAHNEEEAVQLVKDGYHMVDRFILEQYKEDDVFAHDTKYEPDGYRADQLRYDSEEVTEWFRYMNGKEDELPFN